LVLGDEYDDALRQVVMGCQASLGAEIIARQWGLGGSQIIETTKLTLGKDVLVVEAETYVGLSIRGEARLVNRVAALVAEHATSAPKTTR
jgi:hypothetical protein